jgi:hypothetical protein
MAETSNQWAGPDDGMTELDYDDFRNEYAADAFSRPWFYYDDSSARSEEERWADARTDAAASDSVRRGVFSSERGTFSANPTVDDVFRTLANPDDKGKLKAVFARACILFNRVSRYCKFVPVEDRFNGRIICLSGIDQSQVDMVVERHIVLGSSNALAATGNDGKTEKTPLCFVLGSSGSGKTFFALKHAAEAGKVFSKSEKHVVFYLNPANAGDGWFSGTEDEKAVQLMQWIWKEIKNLGEKDSFFTDDKLHMHVTLVLDEAGAVDFDGLFDSRTVLSTILKQLKEISDSHWLVVAGTGVTGEMHSCLTEAVKFRMPEWQKEDL